MTRHVIVGKGAVGTTLAHLLSAAAADVLVLSRSGGTSTGRVTHAAVDATDVDGLVAAARGADVVYNCAAPAYPRWPTDWPPLWASLLDAAAQTGAVLVDLAGALPPTAKYFEDSSHCTSEANQLIGERVGRALSESPQFQQLLLSRSRSNRTG